MSTVRLSREGIALRFGEGDTPVPEGVIPLGKTPRLVVAVAPSDPRMRVRAGLRVNGGPERFVPLRPERRTREEQLFEGSISGLRGGENVEYWVCAELETAGGMLRLDSSEVPGGVGRFQVAGAIGRRSATVLAISSLPSREAGRVVHGEAVGGAERTVRGTDVVPPFAGGEAGRQPPAGGLGGAGGATGGGRPDRRVEGIVLSEAGIPAGGVKLRLYQRGFGGAEVRLGEVTTDPQGEYALPYKYAGTANIELRTVDSQGKEVSLSKTRFGAQEREELNVVAPSALVPRVAEHVQLRTDLAKEVPDLKALAGAVEKDDQEDLTVLHAATGWDARLVSLAAVAEKQSAETGLGSDVLYGAFRAGLPTDKLQLALLGAGTFGQALQAAREAGVIALDDAQLGKAKQTYEGFARATRRDLHAPGTSSSFGDLLARSGLSDKEKNDFEDLYFARRAGRGDLWKAAREKGLPEAKVTGLRLQGKLAALTLNNAALVDSLRTEIPSADKLATLVEKGFYEAAPWKERLTKLATSTQGGLEQLVPPGYVGDTANERLAAYADDLARKVRQSFPTKVVAQRLANDELVLGDDHARVKGPVTRVLKNAEDKGVAIEFGKTPIGAVLRKNRDALFDGVSQGDRPGVEKSLKLLQRLYQVTPSDHALGTLLSLKIGSASEIAALRKKEFLRRYGDRFRPGEAELVHTKCVQVSHVVFNSFIHAQQVLSPSGVGVLSATPEKQDKAEKSLRNHFPTLENLFGSLDYCECEHCRSVLSPAAYLVDLFQYLDPSDLEWGNVLSAWKSDKGTDYPYLKPYDVLTSRRPDLPNIALTCENTNTALPYIDVVNEILEYYVGNGKLGASAARDTGDVSSVDLIAEPRYITDSAYPKLAGATYPLTLPFDLWSETARRFLEHFDTSYSELLETFRRSDELFSTSTDPQSFGHSAVFFEQLDLSPAEAKPFTDAALIENKWWELFGYHSDGPGSPENTALAELSSAKTLSRRLGVTYKELVALVRTCFVNPQLDALVTLKKLDIDIGDILRLKGQPGYTPFSTEEQAAFSGKLADAKTKYAFEATPWIDAHWQAGDFKNVLLLADTKGGCNFDATLLRFADGRPIDKVALVRINLLVRLSRKLRWTFDEVDQSLRVFIPAGRPATTLKNIADGAKTVLIYLAHLKTLDARLPVGKNSRQRLLTFWAPLSTRGSTPLYAQLFLTPSVLNNDAVFDHALGEYLAQPGLLLKDHLPAVQGALGVTAADVELLVTHWRKTMDTIALSLESVSYVLRHAVLAKGLKVSVADLLAWVRVSGIEPFEPLAVEPLAAVDDDRPLKRTIRLVDFVETVRSAGLSIADATYVMRNEFDAAGPHRHRPDLVVALLRDLGMAMERVAADHAIPNDPGTFSDDILRQKLALIAAPDVVDTFLGMWKRSPPPAGSTSVDPVPQIAFDATKAAAFLDRSFPGLFAAADAAVFNPSTLEIDRRKRVAEVVLPFIQRRECWKQVTQAVAVQLGGDSALVESLLTDARLLSDPSGAASGTPVVESYLATATRGLTASFFASLDGSGPTLQAPAVVPAPEIQSVPTQAKSGRIEGFLEVSEAGAFRLVAKADGVGAEIALQLGGGSTPALLGKVTAQGQELEGRAELKPGALVPFALEIRGLAGGFSLSVDGPSLTRGSLSRLILRPLTILQRLAKAHALVSKVLGLTTSLALSEREVRYVAAHPEDFEGFTFTKLPTEELAGLSPGAASAIGKQLLALAEYVLSRRLLNIGSDEMALLLDRMSRVLNAAPNLDQAKNELLTDICEALGQPLRRSTGAVRRLVDYFGFTVASTASGGRVTLRAGQLAKPGSLRRLLRGLEVVAQIGVSVETIVGPPPGFVGTTKPAWAQPIPGPGVQPNPGPDIARGIRDGVRALYDVETWRRVAQPISDKLRQQKRDALVAFVMHTGDFRSMEEMFEYFLLDPGMEPVVYTSRIQLAISSVQTFIQRCFLNLESQAPEAQLALAVPPSALDADHWQWMKRYRVWEANRKIFLFPENWLEPEFRDDKSYLFDELESALLEGDVSNDLVEAAFLKYLKGLEEIARLEVMSCSADEQRGTLHVVARTYNLNGRKYFYRKNVRGSWFPWEPVDADIQGEHVIPVVWRKRLHLFWVTFMEKSEDPSLTKPSSVPGGSAQPATAEDIAKRPLSGLVSHALEVQLHWIERHDGKWVGRGSSPPLDLSSRALPNPLSSASRFDLTEVTIHATTGAPDTGPVLIHLGGGVGRALRLASKNGLPTIMPSRPLSPMAFATSGGGPTFRWGSGPLEVQNFASRQEVTYGKDVRIEFEDVTVLGADDGGRRFELIPLAHRVLSAAAEGDWQGAGVGTNRRVPLYRLYSPHSLDHFYTTSENSRDAYINHHGSTYEGVACEVYPLGSSQGSPLYHLHGVLAYPTVDEFYTTSVSERDHALNVLKYRDLGVTCHVPTEGDTVPLYRVVHAVKKTHFYTTSLAERDNAVNKLGFQDEGIACRVFPPRMTAEEIRTLTSPVFYRDSQHVFFVDPSLEETTFDKWEDWAVPLPLPKPEAWVRVDIVPQRAYRLPQKWPLETAISPETTINPVPKEDWLVNDRTVLVLGKRAFGSKGSLPREQVAERAGLRLAAAGLPLRDTAGTAFAALAANRSVEALRIVGAAGSSTLIEPMSGAPVSGLPRRF